MIKKAVFLQSSPDLASCPLPTLPEFAFIGRSNVGKSSLINMLTRHGNLAKISSVPGKTRHIVFFTVDDSWRLVDLPGYGYAKVSREQRSQFAAAALDYIARRETLHCLLVLVDSRIPPQEIDIRFVNYLGENGIPFALVFTKTDKLPERRWRVNTDAFMRRLSETWETFPPVFFTSSATHAGRDELLRFILGSIKSNN
ncbi:MAG: YihA family ribosome biogenesis GTP-binding protein [Bacteroidales bacterium]|nr:YihA family ribosome biogenesis GTP-binding protein [Bacteroidales bacterium]